MIDANIIVALSNSVCLPFIANIDNYRSKRRLYCAVAASTLYHLAENKYEEGYNLLNISLDKLLLFDRAFALMIGIIVFINIYFVPKKLTKSIIINAIAATICLSLSEYDMIYLLLTGIELEKVDKTQYIIFHSLWHIFAFYCSTKILE